MVQITISIDLISFIAASFTNCTSTITIIITEAAAIKSFKTTLPLSIHFVIIIVITMFIDKPNSKKLIAIAYSYLVECTMIYNFSFIKESIMNHKYIYFESSIIIDLIQFPITNM